MTSADLPVLHPGTPLAMTPTTTVPDSPDPGPGPVAGTDVAGGGWQPRLASPVVGPTVLATAVAGERVVVGGDFTYGTAGMPTGTFARIALWDGTGWQRLGTGLDGAVRAVAVVGDAIYAGGDFTMAGDVPAARLARWDGTAWSAVGGGIAHPEAEYDCTVLALASDGARLYVGGTFARAGDREVRSLAALDLATGEWSDLGGGVLRAGTADLTDPGTVRALALAGTALHVGGGFDTVAGHVTHSFATLDTASLDTTTPGAGTDGWRTYGPGISDEELTGTVHALAVDPATGDVAVGGSFTSAGGVPAWNVAVLRGTATDGRFESLGDVTSYGGKYATVHALAYAGGHLHLGGSFTSVGPLEAEHWVVHDGTSWAVPQQLDNVVRTLAPHVDGVLVGGDFDNAGPLRVQHLGVWSAAGWQLLGEGPHSGYFSGGEVQSLLVDGDGVVAGGLVDQAGAVRLGSIGRWSGTGWDDLAGGVAADVGDGQVFALARLGDDVYAAGSFSAAGGVPAANIARWDGRGWSPLGAGTDGDVHALAVLGGRLYAGGEFALAGGLLVGGLAAWDPVAQGWGAVGGGPLYDHAVNALAVIGDRYLVVGGWFNGFNHLGAKIVEGLHGLTMFDTAAPQDPGDVLAGYLVLPGVSRYGAAGWVRALAVVGGDLHVGGWFDQAGIVRAAQPQSPGFPAANLAVWHFATTGEWAPLGDTDAQVYALAADGDDLLVAGQLTTVAGTPAGRVARLERATGTWRGLGTGLAGPDADGYVVGRALAVTPDGLWVGGTFTSAGDVPSTNLARWHAGPDDGPADVPADVPDEPDDAVGPGTYEEHAPSLTWTGRWSGLRSARDSGGAATRARSGPASVSLRFRGAGVDWVSRRGRTAGINTVWLDDRLVATVDRYAPRTEHGVVVWSVTDLPPGVHTVRVEHTGTRDPAAIDDTVVVDAFVVH
ncbi:hypothetical protein [uncultured Cellulomonas sp.]|uniref:hypothetical protein n=1 Tax=uncultured Cellulomonas sp. TaxID=189682 RepID=UPI0026035FCE|nr:hypothetical protein [uncultured Cellulomonas sp.]